MFEGCYLELLLKNRFLFGDLYCKEVANRKPILSDSLCVFFDKLLMLRALGIKLFIPPSLAQSLAIAKLSG